MSKKLEISQENYDIIKEIIRNSTCMAVAYEKVQEQFNLNREQAQKVTSAVYYNYKYLKIIE